jgi:hypothetical protein
LVVEVTTPSDAWMVKGCCPNGVLDVVFTARNVEAPPPAGTVKTLVPNWHDAPAGRPWQVKFALVEYPASEFIPS